MFSKASHGSQIIKEYPTLTTPKGDTVLIIFSQNIGHYHWTQPIFLVVPPIYNQPKYNTLIQNNIMW